MIRKFTLQLKKGLSELLGRLGLYDRAKASWIYHLYWAVVDRRIVNEERKEVDFYRNLLDGFCRGDLIFDVGANQGYKAGIFLKLGARVVAVEPDQASQGVLRQKFLKYRLKRMPLVIVGKAVSDRSSVEKMWIDQPGSAKNTLSQKWADVLRSDDKRFGQRLSFGRWEEVETVTIEQLITKYGQPFFVKIDVEGHEVNILRGMRRPVPYLSFEVNLPEFRPEGLECVETLGLLAKDGKFNYALSCQDGLILQDWIGAQQFLDVLNSCTAESIEVFWQTSPVRVRD